MRGKQDAVPIAEILKAAVPAHGSQRALAEAIGTTEASVSRWITGKAIPDEQEIPAIAAAVGHDEDTVLAAIALARKLRRQADAIARQRESDNDALRAVQSVVEALTDAVRGLAGRVEGIEDQIAELRRSGPGGSQRGKPNSR